jgi:hypothetical protein
MIKKLKLVEKITVSLIIISILLAIVYFVFNFLINDNKKKDIKVDYITEKFNYILYDKDLELYKTEFKNLDTILKEDEIDYEEYANSISRLFIVDFYSLSNKTSSYDIGGTQYLHKNLKDNFILKASNTLYKYIHSEGLPKVKEISVISTEETEYKYLEKTYFAYKILLKWEYEIDFGYEKEAQLIIIKDNKQLFIVEKTE